MGLGRGQWGWTQPKVFIGWADPLRSPQEGPGGGWEGRGGGNARQKAGRILCTNKAYISSEQNHSFYFMQKTEVECTFQKPSLVLGKTYADEAAGKAQCQVDAKHRLPPGESFPEIHSIFVLCNTSGLNIGMGFLESILKMLNLQNSIHVHLKKYLFIFIFYFLQKPE